MKELTCAVHGCEIKDQNNSLQQQVQAMTIEQRKLESYNAYLKDTLSKYREELHSTSLLVAAQREERKYRFTTFALVKVILQKNKLQKAYDKLQQNYTDLEYVLNAVKEEQKNKITAEDREMLEEASIRG